jgi:hypothetical protein
MCCKFGGWLGDQLQSKQPQSNMNPKVFDGLRAVTDLFAYTERMARSYSHLEDSIGHQAYRELKQAHPPLVDFLDQCASIADLLDAYSDEHRW